jgi:hypothetical protein
LPFLVVFALGCGVGSLIGGLSGSAGPRRAALVLAAVAAGAGLGLMVLLLAAPGARRLAAVGGRRAVRRVRSRGGRGGPESGVLSVVAAPPAAASAVFAPAPPAVVPVRFARAELGERVSLGARSRRLTAQSVLPDDALRAWLAEQSGAHEYDLVRIVCAFRPQAGERFAWGRLVVRLTGPPGSPPAVVVSMLPVSAQAVANRRRTVRLGANLKLVEAGTETESSSSVARPQLTAFGTLQSTAEWHLHSPALLFGEREFLLVVERPARGRVTCAFDVHVRIEWGRDGGDYTAELPPDVRQLVLS